MSYQCSSCPSCNRYDLITWSITLCSQSISLCSVVMQELGAIGQKKFFNIVQVGISPFEIQQCTCRVQFIGLQHVEHRCLGMPLACNVVAGVVIKFIIK